MKPSFCAPPEIFLTTCDVPSKAALANAEIPRVLASVGPKVFNGGKFQDNKPPPTFPSDVGLSDFNVHSLIGRSVPL